MTHGNTAAFKRVLRTIDSFEAEIIGGYHSHPHPYKKISLSGGDIVSIKEDIEAMLKIGHKHIADGWLEILLSIKRKDYAKSGGKEWYITDYIKRLRCHVRTHDRTAYDIVISAYWVYPTAKSVPETAKPKDWQMKVKEVAIFVPWNLE